MQLTNELIRYNVRKYFLQHYQHFLALSVMGEGRGGEGRGGEGRGGEGRGREGRGRGEGGGGEGRGGVVRGEGNMPIAQQCREALH